MELRGELLKVYILWKISISGWDKKIEDIFTTKEKAAAAFKESWFKKSDQYNYTIEERDVH